MKSDLLKNYIKKIVSIALLVTVAEFLNAGTTGKLSGTVTDKKTGEPLIGANVIVEKVLLGAATDVDGSYYVLQIPPGTYSVRFSMIGYQDLIVKDVRIQVDLTTQIDGALPESVIGMNEVFVQAERPMIQTDVTYSQANISSEEVELLPVEEFEDVIALQAGVVSEGGEIHVRGGRGGEISYMVDGVTVTDPFNAGIAVEIENNAIQELQFISGTFNAEYGQAMSGIVNIITKDGDYQNFKGGFSTGAGGYYTKDDKLFPKLNDLSFDGIKDIKGNIEGPILPGRVSFFASGRIKRDNGYLYGQRVFKPNTFSWDANANNFVVDSTVGLGNGFQPVYQDPADLVVIVDSLIQENQFDWVPMNWHEQKTSQVKLTLKLTPRIKMSFNRMDSDTRQQYYSHLYKWNPDGRSHYFNNRIGNLFRLDFSLSQSTFASIMVSNAKNHYRNYLSDSPSFHEELEFDFSNNIGDNWWEWEFPVLDSNIYFVDPRIFDYTPVYNYYVGGQSMGAYNRISDVETYKSEITSQINQKHQLKSGFEYRRTKVLLTDLTVQLASYTQFQPVYQDPLNSPTSDTYGKKGRTPEEFSFYIQDKMESKNMVVNIGLRWDYFDPNWKVVNDLRDPNYLDPLRPINEFRDLDGDGEISESESNGGNRKTDQERLESNAFGDPWFRDVKPKTQFSPRFALAFPITDKGYLHFSYGHFFQNPEFSFLYSNPEFEVPPSSGAGYTMGNADMEPQRTTQYEVGFSQQIGQDIGIELTGYFKDIRNLNSTKIIQSIVAGDRYGLYINKDFANSRGVTVALSKRRSNKTSGNIDYTFSISEGNASDPTAAFYDEQSNIEPEKVLVPLDWDQRHTLNATLTYHPINRSGISFVFSYGSGFPYTTEFVGTRTSFENNAREPATYNVDMKGYYNFILFGGYQISAFVNVYNIFDIQNELTVYNDTGRSTYSLLPTYTPQTSGPGFNTLNEYLTRPDYYSRPRQIRLGLSLAIK